MLFGLFGKSRTAEVARLEAEVARLSAAFDTLKRHHSEANDHLSTVSLENEQLRLELQRLKAPEVPELQPIVANDPTPTTPYDVGTGTGAFSMGIVGESYRQTALRQLAGDKRKRGEELTFTAVLVPEPDNTHDTNAVKVHVTGGAQLGYLSADDALAYRPVIAALSNHGFIACCRACLIGGTKGKPSIGVMLDLAEVDVLVERIAQQAAAETQPF